VLKTKICNSTAPWHKRQSQHGQKGLGLLMKSCRHKQKWTCFMSQQLLRARVHQTVNRSVFWTEKTGPVYRSNRPVYRSEAISRFGWRVVYRPVWLPSRAGNPQNRGIPAGIPRNGEPCFGLHNLTLEARTLFMPWLQARGRWSRKNYLLVPSVLSRYLHNRTKRW
jgi:hypothetical protein